MKTNILEKSDSKSPYNYASYVMSARPMDSYQIASSVADSNFDD